MDITVIFAATALLLALCILGEPLEARLRQRRREQAFARRLGAHLAPMIREAIEHRAAELAEARVRALVPARGAKGRFVSRIAREA